MLLQGMAIDQRAAVRVGLKLGGLVLGGLALAACSPAPTGPADEDFVPGRDLSLAELAGAAEPGVPSLSVRRPPVLATRLIAEAVAEGSLEPWEADLHRLELLLGRDAEVPARFRPEGAILTVSDALPAAVLGRLSGYSDEARRQLEALLDAGRGSGTAVADASEEAWWNPLASRVALAAGAPVEVGADGFVEVTASPGEEGWVGPAVQVAAEVWPRIAQMMNVQLLEPENQSQVRFRQPLTPEAAAALADSGLPEDATGTVNMIRDDGSLLVHFEGGNSAVLPPEHFEVLPTAQPPLRVTLLTASAEMPTEASASVAGRFYSCGEIYVVTGDAENQCTVAGRLTHELFHCAQELRGGTDNKPEWVVEGTASWAQDRFHPGNQTEWSFHAYYAYGMYNVPLHELEYMSSVFWRWADEFHGGDGAILNLFDNLQVGDPITNVPTLVGNWPERWHEYVAATTGYQPLFDTGTDELTDHGGTFPYVPTDGCADDAEPWKVGQEFWRVPQELSMQRFPVYDIELKGPSAQHEIIDVQASEEMQYIDVALLEELDDLAAGGIDDLRIVAVLYGEDGSERVEDWTDRWPPSSSEPLEVIVEDPDNGGTLRSTGSFRICMTDDAPCDEAETTYPSLTEIRFFISWADTTGEPLRGQLVLIPGGIHGWTAKAYRLEPPEHDEEEQ